MNYLSRSGRRTLAATSVAIASCAAAGAPAVHADASATTTTSFGGATEPGGPIIHTTTSVKAGNVRYDTTTQVGPMKTHLVTLVLCGSHQTITFDPALRIAMTGPIEPPSFGIVSAPRRGRMGMATGDLPESGTVVTTLAVHDLGTEKIAGASAHHIKLTATTTGAGGTGERVVTADDWIAPVKGAAPCPERTAATRTITTGRGGRLTVTFKGDTAVLKEIASGILLRQSVSGNDAGTPASSRVTLDSYSAAALADSVFALPAGYRQVPPTKFQDLVRISMMKAMLGGNRGAH